MTQRAATKLPSELGLGLFERSTRGVIPSPHGEALVRHASLILGPLGHAHDDVAFTEAAPSL